MENDNFVKIIATVAGSLSVAAILGGITAIFQMNSRMAGMETQISYISRDLEAVKNSINEYRDNRYTQKDADQLKREIENKLTMDKVDIINRITENQREIMSLRQSFEKRLADLENKQSSNQGP